MFNVKKRRYPYEYINSWKRFDETSLPQKEGFHNNLNMEGITDTDYKHAKKIWKSYEITNFSYYYDLYVQSDTLLLADVFENFLNKSAEIYRLDPAHFSSVPGLAWQARLKKAEIELELLTDINMLLMAEKGIRNGICHVIHRYTAANNK